MSTQFIHNWKCTVVFAITRVSSFLYRPRRTVSFSCQLLGKLKKLNKCTAMEKFRYIWTEMLYLCMKIWTGYQFLYKILLWRPSLNNVLVMSCNCISKCIILHFYMSFIKVISYHKFVIVNYHNTYRHVLSSPSYIIVKYLHFLWNAVVKNITVDSFDDICL